MSVWRPPANDLRICGVQARLFSRDPEENREELLSLCRGIEPGSCDLIVFPEAANLYYHYDLISQLRGGEEERFLAPFRELARQQRCHLLAGSLMVRDGRGLFNRSYLLDPAGLTVGYYDKLHLIPLFGEPEHLTPGTRLFTAEVCGWKLGVAICFDLRFAEIFLNYALAGCHVQVLPACWPEARIEHWYHLHLARAQETQCYFVGVNHGGEDSAGNRFRMSLVAEPDAQVVAELPQPEPGLLRATLSAQALTKQKQLYDLLAGRQPLPMGAGTVLLPELQQDSPF